MLSSFSIVQNFFVHRLRFRHQRTYHGGMILLVLLSITLCGGTTVSAQTTTTPALRPIERQFILPEEMSARRMGLLSDASAVGWNPALLGTRPGLDIVGGLGLDSSFNLPTRNWMLSAFANLGGLSIGYTGNMDRGFGHFFGGLGFKILSDKLWIGGSGRLDYNKDISSVSLGTLAWNGSLAFKPTDGVFAGLSVSTMRYDGTKDMFYSANVVYSPAYWASAFLNLSTYSPYFVGDKFNADLGVSAGVLNDFLVVSATYNTATSMARVGAELKLGFLRPGLLYRASEGSRETQKSIAIARLSSDALFSTAAVRGYSTSDDGCRETIDEKLALPDMIVENARKENKELFTQINQLAPNPKELYQTINRTYYSSLFQGRTTLAGDTIPIVSRKNYVLDILKVDYSKFPTISVVFKTADSSGRNMAGLGVNDFYTKDTLVKILSVNPSDTAVSVPIDIVIAVDCSGSMGEEIEATAKNARAFVQAMKKRGANYRIGGILYGLQVTDILQPTENFEEFDRFISKARANQPDEYAPEAVSELVRMKFRPNAQKIAIFITDELFTPKAANWTQTENQVVQLLWKAGIRTYSVVNPCDNNASRLTYLTLGREYDIHGEFDTILNDIGNALTTTYTITYLKEQLKISVLKGRVTDQAGKPIVGTVKFTDAQENTFGPLVTDKDGNYSVRIVEGQSYTAMITPTETDEYRRKTEAIDLTRMQKGDTVVRNFVFKQSFVRGVVQDESGKPVPAILSISDATGKALPPLQTNEQAQYLQRILEGARYGVAIMPTAATEHQHGNDVIDATAIANGDTLVKNFVVKEYPKVAEVRGVLRDAKTRKPIAGKLKIRKVSDGALLSEITADANGNYTAIIPKDVEVEIVGSADDHFDGATKFLSSRSDTTKYFTGELTLPEDVSIRLNFPSNKFDNPNKYVLDSNGVETTRPWQEDLSVIAENLKSNVQFIERIILIGHTDDQGADGANMTLGQNRANFVKTELVKLGVPETLIVTQSKGKSELLPQRSGEAEAQWRARCRRVELTKVKKGR